ncbi:unnamed protein product [Thlaspi arvense]|uniref:DNA (cytosine-5-)-methyltransferase n=1 Tax=Thlaspi arvense TaxID=13288 RepID=A0AAU9T323_THLAR|nr:unnamed protein product [Thlaspi arvense]
MVIEQPPVRSFRSFISISKSNFFSPFGDFLDPYPLFSTSPMLSPAKCEPEEESPAPLDPHSSSRSDPERLSLVLSLPNPGVSEEVAQPSSREAAKLSQGEMSSRRSTKLSLSSPKESGGGEEGRVSQSKSSSHGKQPLLNSCQVRRSPRFTPEDGVIDNVGSVSVTGEFGLSKKMSSSTHVKKESLDSAGMTFKDIAAIAKSLEKEIVSECQDKNNNTEGRSQVPAKRKVGSDTLSSSLIKHSSNQSLGSDKRTRRSPRFTKGMENCTVISNSDEEPPAKKAQNPVESTIASVGNGRLAPLDPTKSTKGKGERVTRTSVFEKHQHSNFSFIGEPIPCEEAQERWRWRYDLKERKSKSKGQRSEDDEDKIAANVECHYTQAKVDNQTFSLGDFARIKIMVYSHGHCSNKHRLSQELNSKIVPPHFPLWKPARLNKLEIVLRAHVCMNWRAKEVVDSELAIFDKDLTRVLKTDSKSFGKDRTTFYFNSWEKLLTSLENLFLGALGEEEENHIGKIVEFFKTTDGESYFRAGLKPKSIKSDFYFDMEYCVEYSTFQTLRNFQSSENKLECCAGVVATESTESLLENKLFSKELPVLDLYSGCGGMSTGLSLGAKISGVDVVTKWAIDQNLAACESLKLNHPQTQVRNDAAGDFLLLLKEWDKLCKRYVFSNDQTTDTLRSVNSKREATESRSSRDDSEPEEYEVEKLVDICYGDPDNTGEYGLKFKVHWKGYSSNEDSWEPAAELSNCQDAMREFVTSGFKAKILPLPGGVGVICGGPPCQGISGYNRFRNVDSPLTDERNQQIIVFMDIVEYLKPAFVLMENVVDILRLDKGSLGRYALSRLVHLRYQARLGIMTAGCYGLSQFRSRVFMWGADLNNNLPPFPLPSHDVIVRYGLPLEFERNVVAYTEGQPRKLEKALVLKDAISDLPHVSNDEVRENMPYESFPETNFQKYIRSTKHDMTGSAVGKCTKRTMLLHDHRPFYMSEDDYARVCQIPRRKGANFRDLPGLIVRNDNTVCRDPSMNPVILPSGRALVPAYVFNFQQGKSKRPFARLWWDETVPTVLTVPSCHNQIGNAVAVSVSRALGYSLGMAFRGLARDEHVIILPQNFSHSSYLQLQETIPQ